MPETFPYSCRLKRKQREYIRKKIPQMFRRRLKYSPYKILEGILYHVKSGCQWNMLPEEFPKWRCVYNHFRSWSERGWMEQLLKLLIYDRRVKTGRTRTPSVGVIDSQSVKWGVIDSKKGIDGFKKVKGIKRHIITDSQGYLLGVHVTTANIHDCKAVFPLIGRTLSIWPTIKLIKADKGYAGRLQLITDSCLKVKMECVKSNFGTSDFIPMKGRWVVERTFAWFDMYRRLVRNYEKLLVCARNMVIMAAVSFMIKYIR